MCLAEISGGAILPVQEVKTPIIIHATSNGLLASLLHSHTNTAGTCFFFSFHFPQLLVFCDKPLKILPDTLYLTPVEK